MSAPYRWAIRHPARTILLAFALVLPAALGILRLELRTDGRALAPGDAPAIQVDRQIRSTFRIEDPIVVVLESDDARGVFNPGTLGRIRDLTRMLEQFPGVGAVSSLENERSDRQRVGSLRFLTFLDPFPETDQDLERVRADVRALEIYSGTLVSFDERASAIFVGVAEGAERGALVRGVRRRVLETDPGTDRLSVIGAPLAEVLLGVHLLRDLGVPAALLDETSGRWGGLVPLAIAVLFLVFWMAFGSPFAGLPPLIEVGTCILAVLGIMGWCGVPVYLTIAVLPVILCVLGIADEVHVFGRYHQLLRERPGIDHVRLVEAAFDDKWAAVVKTSVTTAIGFLSFTLSPIDAVRAFGLFTALGILGCMAWTLTVIPATLVLLGPARFLPGSRSGSLKGPQEGTERARSALTLAARLERVVRAAAARPLTVIATGGALALLSLFGLAQVRVQDGWISGFAQESEFRRATRSFDEHFFGTHRLLVCVESDHQILKGTLEPAQVSREALLLARDLVPDPETLVGQRLRLLPMQTPERPTDMREWTTLIATATQEGEQLRITTARARGSAEMMRRYWGGGAMHFEITPQRMKRAEVLAVIGDLEEFLAARDDCSVGGTLGPVKYLETTSYLYAQRSEGSRSIPEDTFAIESLWHNYGAVRGELRLAQAVDSTYSRVLVDAYLKDANFEDTARLLESLRDWEREYLEPKELRLSFSGDVATSQALIEAVVSTQIRSVLVSLVGIAVVVALFARSIVLGLLAVLPSGLAVLFNLGLMGATGIPLGVATSMFAAMTLGIGVDYAIHFLEWYRRARREGSGSEVAIAAAARVSGPAIVVDGLAVALGFGVLALSQIPANARLGMLLVSSIAGCLAVSLLLLPALLGLGARRGVQRPA